MVIKKNFQSEPLSGFSLIELLVVIAIISLLITIAVPAIDKARGQVFQIKCSSQLQQIYLAFSAYAANNDDKIIEAGEPTIEFFINPDALKKAWFFALLPYISQKLNEKLLENRPELWRCPVDKNPFPKGFWNCPHDGITSYGLNGYYRQAIGDEEQTVRLGPGGGCTFSRISNTSDCMLLGETSYAAQFYDADAEAVADYDLKQDGHHRCTSGFYHSGFMNILYVDGHIKAIRGKQASELVWPENFEEPHKSGRYMYWPDLKLPGADEKPEFWGPGY
ncbi:MAG: type II secretion system protein [Sedimentisphaerales bacterium]|nr:type II secretion system protein [Sedimentisphaerales bacterium]